MDKSDTQMEEAETALSHQGLDTLEKGSEDGIPDGKEQGSEDGSGTELRLSQPKELPSSPAVTDDKKESHEVDHANSQLSPDNTVVKEQHNATLELKDQNPPLFRKEEQEGVEMEFEDQTKEAQSDHPKEEIKGIEEEEEQQTRAMCEDEEDCLPAAGTETKDQRDSVIVGKERSSSENEKEIKDTTDTLMGEKAISETAEELAKSNSHDGELPFQLPVSEVPPKKKEALDDDHHIESEEMVKGPAQEVRQSETEDLVKKELENKSVLLDALGHHDKTGTKATKPEVGNSPFGNKRQPTTPDFPLKYSSRRSAGFSASGEVIKNISNDAKMAENEDGTPEQQAAFIKELENFYRQRGVDFKPPKFYGQPLNCYKLWTAVIKLGGYDLVTGTKLWRQVGESFHPPKTCTTVSWTFRIFYEKSLLEYERFKVQNGDIEFPATTVPEPSGAENEGNGFQASGSGRARRDAAARAMQGWHSQRLYGYGEEKSPNSMQKRENKVKSIGSLKQKRPNEAELPVKAQRTDTPRQLVTAVVDAGPPADWVKINIRETKDCFEIYALVPGLLREEVRVQSDPAGRVVITGQPEQTDNPWGITSFKKVINLPAKIDPLHTSAVVSLHGRLFVRVPFEQQSSN